MSAPGRSPDGQREMGSPFGAPPHLPQTTDLPVGFRHIDVSQLRFKDDRPAKLVSFLKALLRLTVRVVVALVVLGALLAMVLGALTIGMVKGVIDGSTKRRP